MKKFLQTVLLLALVGVFCWYGTILADRESLRQNLVRLHVVADSDSAEDQAVKLQVRDAIVARLQPALADMGGVAEAKTYLLAHLEELQDVANQALKAAGSADKAVVTLAKEAFPVREYDTFSLPSGVYEALRVVIGSGQGQNWWCVVFPQLCLPATGEGFADAAVSAGFSDTLTDTLTGEYEVRFLVLDWLGEIENFFFQK